MRKVGPKNRHLLLCAALGLPFWIVYAILSFTPIIPVAESQLTSTTRIDFSSSGELSDSPANLCSEAITLSNKQTRESYEAAIQRYVEAARLWREIHDPSQAANALNNAGELVIILGNLPDAKKLFDDSFAISKREKNYVEEVRALNGLAYVDFLRGDSHAVREKSVRALQIARQIKDRSLEAQALSNLAEGVYGTGDLVTAQTHQEHALEIWKSLGNLKGQVLAQVALGYYNANLSEPAIALRYLDDALQTAHQAGDVRGQVLSLNAMGNVKAKLGRKQEALEAYDRAKPLAEQIGDRLTLASILGGTASLYYWMGDFARTITYDEQAMKAFEEIGALWGAAETKLDLGRVSNSIGNREKASGYLNEALELFREMRMRRLEARTLSEIGVVLSDNAEYQKSLETLQQSLKLNRVGQDYRFAGYTLNLIGTVYEKLNDKNQALQNYQEALQNSRIAGDRAVESISLFNIAHVQRDLGNLITAKQELESALQIAESVRTTVSSQDLRASYFASIHEIYELYIDVLMLQHKEHPDRDFDELAFAVSERARARSLLESLQEGQANIREGVDPALLQKEQGISEMLNARADRHMQLLSKKNFAEADRVKKEIDDLATELERLRDQIRVTSPRYAALITTDPLNLQQVQRELLDQDSILLEYTLGDDRSYVWIITRDSFSAHELPSEKEIEGAARKLYNNFVAYQIIPGESLQERAERQKKADESLQVDAATLSKLVLGPLTGKLSNKRLLIVSDGALQYIPFAALYDPDSGPGAPQYLNTNHEIVREPSASTLALLVGEAKRRAAAPGSVAVFADPVFEVDDPRVKRASYASTPESSESLSVKQALRDIGISPDGVQIPRLFASSDEADAIMNSAPWGSGLKAIGFDANRSRVLGEELGRYRIVHFATHGMINNDHPELSGIVLSLFDRQGHSQDGFLRLHDIYNLHLPADLVVLSACSSGLGKDVRGEGLIGLTRGFMYAGASGVVASLWKVDDRATAELMKLFYEGLFKKGLTPSAALRDAQLRMAQQKAWQSPYYWGGFIIQGRYDEQLNGSRFAYLTAKRVSIASVFIVVLVFGAILVVRGRRARAI